jgi:hypothetical protein
MSITGGFVLGIWGVGSMAAVTTTNWALIGLTRDRRSTNWVRLHLSCIRLARNFLQQLCSPFYGSPLFIPEGGSTKAEGVNLFASEGK